MWMLRIYPLLLKWLSEIKGQFIFVNKATFVFFLNKHKPFFQIYFFHWYIYCSLLVREVETFYKTLLSFFPHLNLWLNRSLEFWLDVSTLGFILDHWLILAFLPHKTPSTGCILTDTYLPCLLGRIWLSTCSERKFGKYCFCVRLL